ncbi:MAG: alpha/beta hydrolase [Chloroflexi bacterium]|nr:alpha/beta hydrolase [Chloroflexota bacterium]
MTTTRQSVRRGFVATPHGDIEYREAGEGTPLLMMHATPASSASFEPHFPLIPGRRVIAMTTLGYGESSRPPEPYRSVEQYAQSVAWFLDGLGLDRVDLFGTHTGGVIAVGVAAAFSDRVGLLVLDEVGNYANAAGLELHSNIHRYYEERPDGSHLVEIWRRMGGDRPGADFNRVTQRLIDNLRVNSVTGCEEAYGHMGWEGAGPYAICRFDTEENARRITAPTLLVYGESSKLRPIGEELERRIPRSRLVLLPSEGMFTIDQGPELWGAAVREFLSEPGV